MKKDSEPSCRIIGNNFKCGGIKQFEEIVGNVVAICRSVREKQIFFVLLVRWARHSFRSENSIFLR